MYKINFSDPIHVYFIGIGGISMSGLAQILLEAGFKISGSDTMESPITNKLEQLGAGICYGQRAENIGSDVDLVVYTAAISEDNPEFIACQERNLAMMPRAELLGQIMDNYETAIAVSGTHGKTTLTSMISEILLRARLDPTISVGGILNSIGGNIRVGSSGTFITEACEYTNSFLHFNPTLSIIMNIEEDHMDFFKDLTQIRESFQAFARRLPDDGTLVINGDIDAYEEITAGLNCRIITYGTAADCNYQAKNITFNALAHGTYDLFIDGVKAETISLGVPGMHNVINSLAAIAVSRVLGIESQPIKEGLANFHGTNRRFEYKGEIGGITIVDDYAHHPTEITATLNAARNCSFKRLWCVFQPHTYTRTDAFLKDFAAALCLADQIILTDIYAAREKNTLGIHSLDLKKEVEKCGKTCHYFSSFDQIETFILENCMHGDLLITMGAGDVVTIGEHLLGK